MTLKELAQRFKAQAQNATEKVRQLLQAAEIAEFSVYSPPTAKWKSILDGMGLSELQDRTICATCYNSDERVFARIESLLKKKYATVLSSNVDEMGFRKVFACGQDTDKEPELILCVNWYEDDRASTKAQYRSESEDKADDTDADDNLELDDEDLFA